MAEPTGAPHQVRGREERLTPRIARQVRDLILSGEAPGGTRLRTEHLATRFGVSATPVREALMSLHGEGLVSFQPGRGFAVVPITRQDLFDLYSTQAHLGGELAARAVDRLQDDHLASLWTMQHELTEAITADDHVAADRIEFDLHYLINHVSDAPKLRWLLRSTMSYVPFLTWHLVPGWAEAAPEDHLPLLRALDHRSAGAARSAMHAHIMNVAHLLADLLAERGVLTESRPVDAGREGERSGG